MKKIKVLDTIALLKDLPDKNISKGQVGTVVEKLDAHTYEVEFTNAKGETLQITPVAEKDLILLRFEPA